MKRILIVGSSGAGKTTLAYELSNRLGIPHTELDSIYHQENWQPLDAENFRSRVYEIANTDQWVMCGNYFSKLGVEIWQRADTIIWCDYSFPVVFSRLFRRTVNRGISKKELWNGNRERLLVQFFSTDSLFLWMLRSWNKQKRRYTKLFDKPAEFPSTTLIRLRNEQEARNFLSSILPKP